MEDRWLLAPLIAFIVLNQCLIHLDAGHPVEGDAELLRALRDAQGTAQSAFPHGRLVARVRLRNSLREPGVRESNPDFYKETNADVTVIWDGEFTYRQGSYTSQESHAPPDESPTRGESIETPEMVWTYNPDIPFAKFRDANGFRGDRMYRLRPDEVWFHDPVTSRHTWEQRFDPDDVNWSRGRPRKWIVEPGEGGLVAVTIEYTGTTRKIEIVASLDQGGNVLSCRHTPNDAAPPDTFNPWQEATWEWVATADGRWRLDRMRARYSSDGRPEDAAHFDIDVLEFDADYRPPPERFTLESLNIRDGTRVQEFSDPRTLTRTWVVGGPEAESDRLQEALDRYAGQLRSSGFAAPRREE